MPRFEDELIVKATPEAIYKLIAKSTNFSHLIPELEVKVIEKDEDSQITEWKVETEKGSFSWRQRENFDPELLTIHYSFLEGDWKDYDARWKIIPNDEETELILQAEVIPQDQGLIKNYLFWPFFRKQMHLVCKDIINAVRDRLELKIGL